MGLSYLIFAENSQKAKNANEAKKWWECLNAEEIRNNLDFSKLKRFDGGKFLFELKAKCNQPIEIKK